MPNCSNIWRQEGPLSELRVQYCDDAQFEFSRDGLRRLALRGDERIRGAGGYNPHVRTDGG